MVKIISMTAIMSANDLGDENYLELEWACSLTFLYLIALTTLHPGPSLMSYLQIKNEI
jgi:hypothetical protein